MKWVNHAVSFVGAAFVLTMALIIVVNALGRKIGHPLPGAIGLAGFMLAVVTFLGLAQCEARDRHVKVEAVLLRLSPKNRLRLLVFNYLVALAVYGFMLCAMGVNMLYSWKTSEELIGDIFLPVYPAKTIAFIGVVLMSVQVLMKLIGFIRKQITDSETKD
jgi:TRAP-type C4-dicarboxylate transport system permease small subunit